MKRRTLPAATLLLLIFPWLPSTASCRSQSQALAEAESLAQQGNHKDAADIFRGLALKANSPPTIATASIFGLSTCLKRLNRTAEIDGFLEEVVAIHASCWEVMVAVAQTLETLPHGGAIVAGDFYRGTIRDHSRWVDSSERDRVRALQLLVKASGLLKGEFDKCKAAQLFRLTARLLMRQQGHREAWKLLHLTKLDELPDFAANEIGVGIGSHYAPVDEKGEPVYHRRPNSWEAAATDGERWRWALSQAMAMDPSKKGEVLMQFADFLHNQFGVYTLEWDLEEARTRSGEYNPGLFALQTLREDETVARLATGIMRFTLPDEFNFIRIYRDIGAHDRLARIFENRRQYSKAADQWEQAGNQERVEQIRGAWGRFEVAPTQPAGASAALRFRYRNAKAANLEAREIKVAELLIDIKAYLKSNPEKIDRKKMLVDRIGMELLDSEREKYVGVRCASWVFDLDPPGDHFDQVVQISTPPLRSGAYLVTARVGDGRTSHVVLWIADTVIATVPMVGHTLYFVADAVTGEPVSRANLEFFGYRDIWVGNRYEVSTRSFSGLTDENGLAMSRQADQDDRFIWFVTATTPSGRFAHLTGHVWYPKTDSTAPPRTSPFVITDRPIYRPGQEVKFKFWINQSRDDEGSNSPFTDHDFRVNVVDPFGKKVLEKIFTADRFGGFEGQLELDNNARLGRYTIGLAGMQGTDFSFMVEEYKKPEFEVMIQAPSEPVRLGDKFQAKVTARYFHGTPVSKGTVNYRVIRFPLKIDWAPPRHWDWLYGPGYWHFGYDFNDHTGWTTWGAPRLPTRERFGWWREWPPVPAGPEVVADNQISLNSDGTASIPIDTSIAKELHGNLDHRYWITAEVRDESRRIVVGSGSVIAARTPIKASVELDRGHYRVGDQVTANFAAHRLDGKSLSVQGEARLFKLACGGDGRPIATRLQAWPVETQKQGPSQIQFTVAAQGQYRMTFTSPFPDNDPIECDCVFNVTGPGFDGADSRFESLELVPDKGEYAPGEMVRLLVNSDQANTFVLLFPRVEGFYVEKPIPVRIQGKSTLQELRVLQGDMPNFFVEALTVRAGRVYTVTRLITVPPESRILDVKVQTNSKEFKPGEMAEFRILLTDSSGKPFSGQVVLTLYDKSLEYFCGGSNVPGIKEHFWRFPGYRRDRFPGISHSLFRFGIKWPRKNKYTSSTGAQLVVPSWQHRVIDEGELPHHRV